MGDVLTFKPIKTGKPPQTGKTPQTRRASGASARGHSASGECMGEIVFFPGVRIERHTVDMAHRVSPRTRGSSPEGRRKPGKRS